MSDSPCIFCRIVRGELPAAIVHRDEEVLAFHDSAPQAPTHILILPIRHIASVADLTDDDRELAGRLLLAAARIAEQVGLRAGYRLVTNSGRQAGQSVDHLHLHLLGGRPMKWPPG
ncbi:MAG TPA: histidine triad nucleotide-binding protein [Anaerolineae bacterium]|nr:histidine triad nucleotide-binding protein [Anaerolineae bacterium]